MTEEAPDNLVAQTWSGSLHAPASIPATADVVVIGGGIVGIATAWFLAKRGVDEVVCEKEYVAGEQSGRNWGWVRQQGRYTREMPMIIESLRIWRGLEAEIGEDVGYSEQGVLFAAKDDEQLEQYTDWIKTAEEYDLDTRMLDPVELATMVRGAKATWRGALYTASDGRAEPHKATPAIARAAVRSGAKVLRSCAVRGIETSAGRVAGVVTEHGTIKSSVVLCAAGAWTSMFCRSLGVAVPQLKVRGTVVRTAAAENILNGCLFDDRLALRRRQDGGYTLANGLLIDYPITPATFRFGRKFMRAFMMDMQSVQLSIGREFANEWSAPRIWSLDSPSPFEETRVLNPKPNPRTIKSIRKNLDSMFPSLSATKIVEAWAGMIETTPDVIPVIDETSIGGLHVATGFSGHGFGIGPGAGKAIAGMLTGDDSGIDLSEFRLDRFFDGTPIRPQASV